MSNSIGVSGTHVPYIMVRGLEDPSKLNAEEAAQFLFWMNGSMRMYQHQHLMFLEDNLSRDSWSSTEHLLRGFVGSKGYQAYWIARKSTFSEKFQIFIDNMDVGGEDYQNPIDRNNV